MHRKNKTIVDNTPIRDEMVLAFDDDLIKFNSLQGMRGNDKEWF